MIIFIFKDPPSLESIITNSLKSLTTNEGSLPHQKEIPISIHVS